MNIGYRFAVNVTPKAGILDPQGRAVESSLPHLGIEGVSAVRVGRRVEMTVAASDEAAAHAIVERLARELLSNPLIESYVVELLGEASAAASDVGRAEAIAAGAGAASSANGVVEPGSSDARARA